MYYSWLLLYVLFSVFSDITAAPVHKRGLLPTNINIDIKLGKQNTTKNVETPPGTHKAVINAPFGLGSLTISTSHQKPEKKPSINEPEKPCVPEADAHRPQKETLGGKGSAFFGPPPPPSPVEFYGPPPPYHYPHHDCNHDKSPPPVYTSKIPISKPTTKIPNSTPNERIPSTTEDVDNLIDNVFGGANSSTSSTTARIETANREITGEGTIDIRRPVEK